MGDQLQFVEARTFKEELAQGKEAGGYGIRKGFPVEVKQVEDGEDGQVLRFTISTADVDRDGDTIAVDGWDIGDYQRNPVVLWAHSHFDPPVAKSQKTWIEGGALRSEARFTPEDLNPFGHMVGRLYQHGFMNATSVGFLPTEWEEAESRATGADFFFMPLDFKRQALLEYSTVPVPSNPNALLDAKAKGIVDLRPMVEWAEKVLDDAGESEKGLWVSRKTVEKIHGLLANKRTVSVPSSGSNTGDTGTMNDKVVPSDVSRETAPEETEWSEPTLQEFVGDSAWDDLTEEQKTEVAQHYAYGPSVPPENFSELKLPHHRASDGAVVWRGVAAAAAALEGARGGVDLPEDEVEAVRAHIASHYRQFDRTPPWEDEEEGAREEEGKEPDADEQGKHWKLKLYKNGQGAIEVDGEPLKGVRGVQVCGSVDALPSLLLDMAPETVEIEGQGTAEEKRGRVLSTVNEGKLQQARDLVQQVLDGVRQDDENEEEDVTDFESGGFRRSAAGITKSPGPDTDETRARLRDLTSDDVILAFDGLKAAWDTTELSFWVQLGIEVVGEMRERDIEVDDDDPFVQAVDAEMVSTGKGGSAPTDDDVIFELDLDESADEPADEPDGKTIEVDADNLADMIGRAVEEHVNRIRGRVD